MSDVMQFLEALGRNPTVSSLNATGYANAVNALGLETTTHQALLNRDTDALNQVLGGRKETRCLLVVPD